jgi:hypothetical protein
MRLRRVGSPSRGFRSGERQSVGGKTGATAGVSVAKQGVSGRVGREKALCYKY